MARFNSGWVKLYREALEKDLSQNLYLWGLWCWLLANANWKDSQLLWNGKQKILKPGDVVVGVSDLARLWKIDPMTIWKWLKYLRDTGRIVYATSTRGTIVSVCNWDVFQSSEDSKSTPSLHQVDTNSTPSLREVDTKSTPSLYEVDISKEGKKERIEEPKKIRTKEVKTPKPKPEPKLKPSSEILDSHESSAAAWGYFEMHWRKKYPAGHLVRNAMTNSQMLNLMKRISKGNFSKLIPYYLGHPDPYFAKEMHMIGPLLKNCEKLMAEMTSGNAPIIGYQKFNKEDTRRKSNDQVLEQWLEKGEELDAQNRIGESNESFG